MSLYAVAAVGSIAWVVVVFVDVISIVVVVVVVGGGGVTTVSSVALAVLMKLTTGLSLQKPAPAHRHC